MREINIPAIVTVNNTDFDINFQVYQDNVISALVGSRWEDEHFNERTQGNSIEDAVRWIKSQLVVINPFVIPCNQYYIGETTIPSYMARIFDALNINAVCLAATGTQPTGYRLYNGDTFTWHTGASNPAQYIDTNIDPMFRLGNWTNTTVISGNVNTLPLQSWYITMDYYFYPQSAIAGSAMSETTDSFTKLSILINGIINASLYPQVNIIRMSVSEVPSIAFMKPYSIYGDLIGVSYEDMSAEVTGFSGDDPYVINPSTVGGGYGTGAIRPSDPIPDPDAPTIDAVSTGLLTVFKPTLSQVNQLGDYLWSSAFDVNQLKKLFGDPMEAIIGLSIVPINPPAAGSKSVKIGDVDTGITMSYIGRQFVEKDLGSITIDPYIGSFMDYAPYTKISIYLPYVGFRDLSPEDVMGTTLSIKYIIDVITGGCNAVVSVSGKGAIYQFNGSCIANIPLSAINYSGAIQNAVSAIGSGLTTVAGFATGNAPVGVMGVAGLASSAANTAVNAKPTIQHSGSMGGAAGLCSVQFPYVIIERPRISAPERYNNFIGNTLNVTKTIKDCKGLTVVDAIHLDNVICTEGERDELLRLLKEGVIFDYQPVSE